MRVLALIALFPAFCIAQTYPRWFLDPGELFCGPVAAGFSIPYFHTSSSDSIAFVDGCVNLSRLHYLEITGGEAYWSTEAGVYWMGNDFIERVDSSYQSGLVSRAARLDSCTSGQMTIVLVGQDSCDLPDSMRSLIECPRSEPGWVENIPQSSGYVYAEGVAPHYFYESSSWDTAERRALFNLARSINLSMEALQKLNGMSGQQIMNEEITVTVRNAQVVERWRDARHGLCYVLVRMATSSSLTGGGSATPKE